jgi:lysozyme family protein
MNYQSLSPEYASLWDSLEINSNRRTQVTAQANRILRNRQRYEEVATETGVPWFVIGIIHMMEGDCDFDTHLHNGDPLTARTRNVPRGRPTNGRPPFAWEDSAIDALLMKRLDTITDWNVERIAYELERYNGWGYRLHHPTTLSPYLWSGSQHYARGKYVADGVWSSSAVSQQIGAMVLLLSLASLTRIDVRPQRQQRQRVVTRTPDVDRLGRANEMKLDNKAVGAVAGIGGAGAASLAQFAGSMPSWQTMAMWAVALGLTIYLAPKLWRFMNAR